MINCTRGTLRFTIHEKNGRSNGYYEILCSTFRTLVCVELDNTSGEWKFLFEIENYLTYHLSLVDKAGHFNLNLLIMLKIKRKFLIVVHMRCAPLACKSNRNNTS